MKKNKKLLVSFLALNSILSTYLIANTSTIKYEKLYNRMIKNIEQNKTNKDNYKMIERLLTLKNKELKDLYLQNSYIMKPEFIEWQISFSSFYGEKTKGDNTLNNAPWDSRVQGYFDEKTGKFTATTSGKPYKRKQDIKTIEIGMSIPLKKITKDSLNLVVNPNIIDPSIPAIQIIEPLNNLYVPSLDLISFNPKSPNIQVEIPNDISIYTPALVDFANNSTSAPFNNMDIASGTYKLSDYPGKYVIAQIHSSGYFGTAEDTILIVDVYNRSAVSVDTSTSSMFTNNGLVDLVVDSTAGLEVQSHSSNQGVTNSITGKIIGSSNKQVALIFTGEQVYTTNYDQQLINEGSIIMNGTSSTGIAVNGHRSNTSRSWVVTALNKNIIELNGKESYGLASTNTANLRTGSSLLNDSTGKIYVNNINSGGIVIIKNIDPDLNAKSTVNKGNINISSEAKNSFGIYSKVNGETVNEGNINILSSEKSLGLRSEGFLSNGSSGTINITNGSDNVGLFSSKMGTIVNNGLVNIDGGIKNVGATVVDEFSLIKNESTISVIGEESIGVIAKNKGKFENNGTLIVRGLNAYGLVAEDGYIEAGTVDIDLIGQNSIGAYAGEKDPIMNVISNIRITGGSINVTDGGVNFNAGKNGVIDLDGANFTTGSQSLGFYTTDNGSINLINANGLIKGGTTTSSRGTAFYVNGDGIGSTNITTSNDIITLLASSGITINNLKLTMEDGSRLFSLGEVSIDLSVVDGINATGFPTINIQGNNYKTILLHKGLLNINKVADLDNPNSDYSNLELANSSITNNNLIKGSYTSQYGMAQANMPSLGISAITLINNGDINLSGNESVGIYTDYGIIDTNGSINMLGEKSYGIFGVNGTNAITGSNSLIKVISNSSGVVLQSYTTDPNTGTPIIPTYGNGTFSLDHNGEIKVSGVNSFGIYANNNDPSPTRKGIINLRLNSTIDMSETTDKSTALYANKTTVNSYGNIRIGTNGIGIFSNDSDIKINGGTIDIIGNNSTGIFLDQNSSLEAFTGTTINVIGDNSTIFLIRGGSTSLGLENVSLNIAPNLKITLASIKDNSFSYNGLINGLGKDSILIIGDNSNISLSNNSIIKSTSENVIGLATTLGTATNNGTMEFLGNNSIGIYANNAPVVNNGNIILDKNSVGVYNKGNNINNNSGKIALGENSLGLFGNNSPNIVNNAEIESMSNNTIGIYADGNISSSIITNNYLGKLNLYGENNIGIYVSGISNKSIINNGEIEISHSQNQLNPSVGIYTINNSINNTGKIQVGDSSLGIYNKNGTILHSGKLIVGKNGTGIFAENTKVDINGEISIETNEAIAIYGKDNTTITNTSSQISIADKSFGFLLENGSSLDNTGSFILGNDNILVYGNNAGLIKSSSSNTITATGSNNVIFYTSNGGYVDNNSKIIANTGTGNIGIYNSNGTIKNTGDIFIKDSDLVYDNNILNIENSKYSVGIYGENSQVNNSGNINIGENAVGIYVKDNTTITYNSGNIIAGSSIDHKNGAIGIFAENSEGVYNDGTITLYGDNTIGIAGKNAKTITNNGTINIEGKNAIGIYGVLNTKVINTKNGIINISGEDAYGIKVPSGTILNMGQINISNGATESINDEGYPLPDLVNIGIIKVDGKFTNNNLNISLKPDLNTIKMSNEANVDFELSSGTIMADEIIISDTIKILPDFSQGTNVKVYKLSNVFMTSKGNITFTQDELALISRSLTWEATPKSNNEGNIDIYMNKISYDYFTHGLWYEDFGLALDDKYMGANGNAGIIFDKIDLIEEESDFRTIMSSLAGNIYANMNQREDDITRILDNTLSSLQNSSNNTKENFKLSVIGAKGETKEDTDGIVNYSYTSTGILALREIEKTYNHKLAYSLAYLHTNFDFKDGNESTEKVNTLQLGFYNNYTKNNWVFKNSLSGKISLYDIDRTITWSGDTEKSNMTGNYETYSIISDNILGKEFSLGKNIIFAPYSAIKAMYITRPSFKENGTEALEIKENDAWSVKPRLGLEIKSNIPLDSKQFWAVKGSLDLAYEYELANLNEREKARLVSIEDKFHNLSKPEKEKGTFKTKGEIGIELKERYGLFLTGEYSIKDSDNDDYKVGVNVKVLF